MNSSTGKTSCSLAIGRVDDDQRIRDYFTKRDNIFASAERVINLTNVLKDGVIDWNNAKTPVQGAAAYDSFYANSRLYAIELDGMFSHIDANVDFLKANKIYFDSQGMDTQSEIDKMIDYKTSFKSSTIRTKSDVELMSQQLQLDAQKQQQTNDLLDTLSRLASEG